jgi:predicted aconitase with swiveling domain
MVVACELATHGAAQGRVVCEEASVVDSPHELLLVGELDVGEGCVIFVESEVGAVLRGAGEQDTMFGCL